MRRRQHDRVDGLVRQQRVVGVDQSECLRLAERLHLRRHRARRTGDEPNLVAVGHRFHQRPPPPPHAHYCGSNHSDNSQLPTTTTHRGSEALRPRSPITKPRRRGGAEATSGRAKRGRIARGHETHAPMMPGRACVSRRRAVRAPAQGRRHSWRPSCPRCLSASVCRSRSPRLRVSAVRDPFTSCESANTLDPPRATRSPAAPVPSSRCSCPAPATPSCRRRAAGSSPRAPSRSPN